MEKKINKEKHGKFILVVAISSATKTGFSFWHLLK